MLKRPRREEPEAEYAKQEPEEILEGEYFDKTALEPRDDLNRNEGDKESDKMIEAMSKQDFSEHSPPKLSNVDDLFGSEDEQEQEEN